jgi:hypothetical protein
MVLELMLALGASILLVRWIVLQFVITEQYYEPPPRRDIFAAARELQRSFQSLGNMIGKTDTQIIAVAGPPNSRSTLAGGRTLLQWQSTGYHIALQFDADGKCLGITHEFVA